MGSFFGSNSGSTIQARGEVNVLGYAILIVVIVLVLAAIFFISKYILSYKNSPQYVERQKRRPTSVSDINQIAKEAQLSKEEKNILMEITKVKRTPNILYLVQDHDELESLMKEQFKKLDVIGDEEKKVSLFTLRKKLVKTYKKTIILKNTKSVETGTTLTFTLTKGFHHKLEILENTPDGMILSVPQSMEQMKELPAELSKIQLIFETKDGFPYKIEARVIRYIDGNDGSKRLITAHTDKITPLQMRQSERVELQLPCIFSSVKTSEKKKGEISYERAEKTHEGTLEDVSIGGCRLITTLPIKPDQFIYIEGQFNRKVTDSAIGSIVRTTKRIDGMFILHVRFLKIENAATNRIQALAIGYDD